MVLPTERLYYADACLRDFEGTVIAVRHDGWAALDRSAFYPTSGGQPFDTGVFTCGDEAYAVLDVQVEENVVWHRTDRPLAVGQAVRGQIDWPRRWDHMQQHAGDHMLAGAIWQLYGGVTIGLHLGKEDSTIDVRLPDGRPRLTEEEVAALETLVNRRVQQDDPIRCWFPDAEELARLPLRKQPTVNSHVRVVAMGDYEMVPCGGTHPASTGQIGPVKVLSVSPAKGNMRLRFVAGMRAVRYFQQASACAASLGAALSSSMGDAPDALQRERQEQAARLKDAGQRLLKAALHIIAMNRKGSLFSAHLPFADHDTLVRAAAEITGDARAVALLSCPGKSGHLLVFARGAEAREDMAALLRACGARGGGKPDLAQGSAPDGQALLRAEAMMLQEKT